MVEDKKGVVEIVSVVNSISGAIENAELLSRVALAVRMVHQAAQDRTKDSYEQRLPSVDHELYLCACGDRMFTATDAIAHCEEHHASATVRKDLAQLENTIEALITPNPLTDWDALATDVVPLNKIRGLKFLAGENKKVSVVS